MERYRGGRGEEKTGPGSYITEAERGEGTYLVILDDRVVQLIHKVVHQPQEPQGRRAARVDLEHLDVRVPCLVELTKLP